jgi:ABC-type transport system involved in cytochrome c biogenesis permease subunit
MSRLPSVLVVAFSLLWLGLAARAPKPSEEGFDFSVFGKTPVVHGGRVLPIDTVARNYLHKVSERESYRDPAGKRQPAIRWLLDMLVAETDPARRAGANRVVRITHPQLLHQLGLEPRDGFRYGLAEFSDRLPTLASASRVAHERDEAKKPLDSFDQALLGFEEKLGVLNHLLSRRTPHLLTPREGESDWRTLSSAAPGISDPPLEAWTGILQSYLAGDAPRFNEIVGSMQAGFATDRGGDLRRSALEAFFNRVDPVFIGAFLYLAAFLLNCGSWLGFTKPLNRASTDLIRFTLVLHTIVLIARVYISGRPPVTNLYSSALFIGWAIAGLALLVQRVYRLDIGNTVAGAAGFLTMLIATALGAGEDTMAVLVAVLDTGFWLSTHVICITIGYATTFISGLIGIVFILQGLLTTTLTDELRKSMARMIYGTVCFAMFFSFVGTVLGGLWADDSWGRFWGWDPKENGALLIVLWNAIILHARWGGLVRERGFAVMAVFGNVVTAWSWFGTNQLGAGLHAYGFRKGMTIAIIAFVVSQLLLMAVAAIPERLWRSRPAPQGAHAEDR